MRYPRKGIVMFVLVGLILIVRSAQHAMNAKDVDAGRKLYQTRCSPYHGSDGKAATPTAQALNPKPRDHTDGTYMNQLSNEHIAKIIKNGGPAVGKSPMIPPQADLTKQQIEDVISFVRTLAVPPYSGK